VNLETRLFIKQKRSFMIAPTSHGTKASESQMKLQRAPLAKKRGELNGKMLGL
jgi:hypothetical protein